MLFDERPKESKEDLYDREGEMEELKRAIDRPLVVLRGIRRIGKTSVLKVSLKGLDHPCVIMDARGLKTNYGRRELYSMFARALSSSGDKLRGLISSVRGIKVLGYEVELSWTGKNYLSLVDLFDNLNRRKVVIAIDEAQNLRGPLSKEVLDAMAHAYDYDRNLTFILTGSEVGFLYDFMGVEDSESPLYGRSFHEVVLDRFNESQSREFLLSGFRQAGLSVKASLIDEAVRELDGIPGWLTFFGNSCLDGRCDVMEIKRRAVNVAIKELGNLLKGRTARYKHVLKAIAQGRRSWSSVKDYMEEKERSTISSSVFHNLIRNLEMMSIVKDYEFLDPIYEEASKTLRG